MPDLLTHFTAAYVVSRPLPLQRFIAVFYFGTVLPDLISRPLYILVPKLAVYTVACHTPVFVIFTCLLLGEMFQRQIRTQVCTFMLAGAALHFMLDAFQKHLFGGYYWLFPFSWKAGEIGLFWPEEPLRFIPLWIIFIIVMEILLASIKAIKKSRVA